MEVWGPAAAQFPNHENFDERNADWGELATKASSTSNVCLPPTLILETQTHDGSFETQTWLDILNFKPVVGMAPPVQPCSSLSLSAGFDSVHG